MTRIASFGEYIRKLRDEKGMPLRKVAAVLDIDPSTLGKIERGERTANKEMTPFLADVFGVDSKELRKLLMSDKVAYELLDEEDSHEILKVAEEKIEYLRAKQ